MKCCICEKKIKGYGNNPFPLKNEGKCCDNCYKFVILARLSAYGIKGEWLKNDK